MCDQTKQWRYLRFEATAPFIAIPQDKRVPFGWTAVAVEQTANSRAIGGDKAAQADQTLPASRSAATEQAPPASQAIETTQLLVVSERGDEPDPKLLSAAIEAAFLRITVAVDVREEKRIEAILPESGRTIGVFDIRYAYALQIFELPVPVGDVPEIRRSGLLLRMVQGEQPLWFLTGSRQAEESAAESKGTSLETVVLKAAKPAPAALQSGAPAPAPTLLPHLLLVYERRGPAAAIEPYCAQLASLSSIQPFGWMEGCVLDGLFDLGEAEPANPVWRQSLQAHLGMFIAGNGGLVYEDPRSRPSDRHIYGIEGTLPFAVIAKLWPDHPLVQQAVQFWKSRTRDSDGLISDGSITTEGAYTIAYPLAVIAKAHKRRDLAEQCVRNLLIRRDTLRIDDGGLYWIDEGKSGERSERYANWARAYAWYMLGLVRSIAELREMDPADRPATQELEAEFVSIANTVCAFQGSDGLWACFADDPKTGADTSGSAGIAAAIAIATNLNLLPADMLPHAERAYAGLLAYLTPDGLLAGVSQSNRNGEALQRSGYRVISQMAMGLMGQLAAALLLQSRPDTGAVTGSNIPKA